MILGDLNIDSSESQDQGINTFHDFCDVFDLSNLIKGETCTTKKHSSSIDVILTNKKRLFKNSGLIETRVSDFHKKDGHDNAQGALQEAKANPDHLL